VVGAGRRKKRGKRERALVKDRETEKENSNERGMLIHTHRKTIGAKRHPWSQFIYYSSGFHILADLIDNKIKIQRGKVISNDPS
jgi:hypothetical protein